MGRVHLVSFLCLLAAAICVRAVSFDGVVRSVGDGRYEAYMIPPDKANHASFLELLPNGDVLMTWFSGTKEGANKCSIVMARLTANETQWSKASVLSQREGYSNQNPVLFYDPKTKILNLFHSQQPASSLGSKVKVQGSRGVGSEVRAHVWHLESHDMGVNWTSPIEVFKIDGSYDRNRIINSLDGGLIFPIYYSVSGDENQHSAMKLSSDHVDWKGYTVDKSNYLVQPSVVRPTPNKAQLLAFFRDRRAKHVYSSTSSDEGKTWTKPEETTLPNNNAAIQATVLANGHMAIVYNPTTHARDPITISISLDGGQTWQFSKNLEKSSVGFDSSVEYSYPSIVQSPDGYIHVSYTYNRDTIKYVRFMEDWVHQ